MFKPKIKILHLIDIVTSISYGMFILYLCFKILNKVIFYHEDKMALILLVLLTIHIGLIFIILRKIFSPISNLTETKNIIKHQNLFAVLLFLFALYVDYFTFQDVSLLLGFPNIENLVAFIVILFFNMTLLLTIVFSIILNFNKRQLFE
jgi:hypothetical protein